VDTEERAKTLARGLVERRLAACVQMVPSVLSMYRWKGEVRTDPEILLLIKSRRRLLDRIREFFEEAHPYEVPELVASDIPAGGKDYLEWLDDNLTG
jgi:periplasmic divalent cation tolerance protein